MAGLFMSPQDALIMQQQQNASMDPFAAENQIRGSLFNLGGGLGRGLIQATGGDPRSLVERRAAGLQDAMQGIDFNDPASITATMNRLNEAGFQNEALTLLQAIPTPQKPQKQVVDEWIQVTGQGNTTRRSLFQRDNFGFVTEVGAVTDTAQLGTFNGLGNEWQRDVQFDEDSRNTFFGQVSQLDTFKSLVGDTDLEDLGQFTGLIAKVANDLKDDHRRAINEAVMNGVMTTSQANAAVAPSDDWYLSEAYRRFEAAGGIKANIDTGMGIQGASVSLDPRADTTNPQTLQARIERGEKKAEAIANVAARTGSLVLGNPETGQFTVGGLAPEQASLVFNNLFNKTDEQVANELTSMGFEFTDQMFDSHAKVWQLMRENPFVTSKFVNLTDNKDLYDAEATRVLDQLDEANNFQQFATASRILKYIRRVGPSQASRKQQEELRKLEEEVSGS